MGIDAATLNEIVRRIVAVASVEQIILFGSAATGQMTKDSDIDLLVVEKNPTNRREESIRIRRALRGMGFPFDVFVMAKERFDESRNVIGGLAYPAFHHGKVVYEAP